MDAIKAPCPKLALWSYHVAIVSITVHAKHNTQLLEPLRGQCSRWQCDLVILQVLDDLLDSFDIFGELGIIRLVSLGRLFCSCLACNSRGRHQGLGIPKVSA